MEAIGTLAGGIAHDFNNILMAIFAYGGMLKNDLAKHPKLRQMADQILKSADRAKDLVQQILTLSRQEEHKREIIRLEPVIKEAVKFLRASLPVDIKIELSLSPDAPTVLADSTQIYQVVMNLVTNAFHAMEGKPGRLSIVLDRFTPDRALLESNPKFHPICYARLTATDTGHGMDAKTIERIFEPFFTTKGVGKGTGLGLAVVHGVAQSHDAVITVASELEKGTSFSLYFPEQKLEADLASHSICDLPMGNGQRILVVDDEGTLAAMFERLLHLLHYRPIVCTNPLEALKLFKNNPSQFDMVVTDHAMPEMSGLELAREIRTIHENVPLVVISGFIGSEIQEKYHEAGIREMIRKPAAITDVAQILHRNLIC
jgi:CheY-like chemotaxis protein